jgi:hypothetical protein
MSQSRISILVHQVANPSCRAELKLDSYRYAQNIGADTNVNDFKAIETLRRMPV